MHWPRIRGLCSVSCSVWLRANGTEISATLWALRLGKDFTLLSLTLTMDTRYTTTIEYAVASVLVVQKEPLQLQYAVL